MRVFSYVVRDDTGFAPNPFHGACTLACCKPVIRRCAQVGDMVVGLCPGSVRVVYAMRVAQVVDFADYWSRPEFASKRPNWSSKRFVEQRGDNIYEPIAGGGYRQLRSAHSNLDGAENLESKQKDVSTDRVLVASQFIYYGGNGPQLRNELGFLRVSRGHRSRFTKQQINMVEAWFVGLELGVVARPTSWPSNDESWRH